MLVLEAVLTLKSGRDSYLLYVSAPIYRFMARNRCIYRLGDAVPSQ